VALKVWAEFGSDHGQFSKVLVEAKARLLAALETAPPTVAQLEALLRLHGDGERRRFHKRRKRLGAAWLKDWGWRGQQDWV
jgi:hypothetical protein